MTYYTWTDESKMMKSGEVFRIQALEDIPSRFVKKGDVGGFMCKKSVLMGTAWVSVGATVVNSTLRDDVAILGNALIENCILSGKCHIQNDSWLLHVTGSGIFASGEVSIRSTTMHSDKPKLFGFSLEAGASIFNSTLLYTGDGKHLIQLKDFAKIEFSQVEGSHMEFNKHTMLRYAHVTGSNFLFENVPEVHDTVFRGKNMEFNRILDISKSTINGENLVFKGGVKIRNMKMDATDSEFYGMGIVIEDSTITGKNIYIQDYVNIQYVDIQGQHVLLSNHASLVGKKDDHLLLLGNVQIREFVQFAIEEGRKSNVLSNEEIDGDFVHTGN